MPRVLDITGEYPADWKQISDATWAAAGHRCIRCHHPYRKGEHGKGEWTACSCDCTHGGPLAFLVGESIVPITASATAAGLIHAGKNVLAQWRIGTVHHLDGDKSNCRWWNLLALCQRCHLTIQSRVNPHQPYMLEHSEWFKPYVAAFYAFKYEGRDITREEAVADLERLLAYERVA
ncbi:MAG: HNH endonuclease [Candidatus Didemnitutus sp.]|nr:HNH endonuclease [Candidatus Didemnitutus sp.]